jgi:histidine triad (HIT) family protein
MRQLRETWRRTHCLGPDTAMTYDDSNIFAKIIKGEIPCHKVYENDRVLAFMDIMPRGDGHALVVPKTGSRNILDVSPDDLAEVMKVVQLVSRAAMQAFDADGLTIQQFNESAGGQVVFHLHFHIIPRWQGVALKPHTGTMEKPENLATFAEKLRRAIGQ